jgi:type I restriction enzyme S subunit
LHEVVGRSVGVSYPAITSLDLADIPIFIPPISQQHAIADYLDRETARIDALITAKTRLLELLTEKRRAIITHAVMHGLNPNVPMRDSGVEWLGEIPSHWEIKKLRYIADLKSGVNITAEQITENNKFPVYGGNGLRGYTDTYTHDGNYVLIGRQGALCGNINYANGKFWASEHAVVVTPTIPIETIWLGELLRIMDLNQYSVSAAQPGLAVDRIKLLKVPLPPIEEQQDITEYIIQHTKKIDHLAKFAQDTIALLHERRAALITAVVSGKILVS